MRCAFLLATVVAVVAAPVVFAADFATFSNPTQVNLLQRWDYSGTWMIGAESNLAGKSDIQKAFDFPGDERGWRVDGGYTKGEVRGTFTFDKPVTIGEVSVVFRWNHGPNNLTFSFANGDVALGSFTVTPPNGTQGRYFLGDQTITLGGQTIAVSSLTITSMTISSNPSTSPNGEIWELWSVGAYLAAGQQLGIDGTYNVFNQESPTGTWAGGSEAAKVWATLDHSGAGSGNTAGYAEWHFGQAYEFYGASITPCFEGWNYVEAECYLHDVQILVSNDKGLSWTPLNKDPVALWTRGYLQADGGTPVLGDWVRLEWKGGGIENFRDISSFQLFGAVPVPEPATMSLLALGGLAMLHRRRAA